MPEADLSGTKKKEKSTRTPASEFPVASGHKKRSRSVVAAGPLQDGDYLLSHLRSTIGVTKLNFSVRNGKRWNLRAIVT